MTESAAAGATATAALPRTDRDLPLSFVGIGLVALAGGHRRWSNGAAHEHGSVRCFIIVFGFLFVTVSSRLTGEIGSSSNPISGMTIATLLLTCLIFLLIGWTGEYRITSRHYPSGLSCVSRRPTAGPPRRI